MCSLLRGTPTRPHPTVSYAANRRRADKAVTDNGPLHSQHRRRFRSPQRAMGDGLSFLSPPTGGTTPTRRKGGDGSGCPRSKLHTRPP
ncbi:hypothetical protein C0Q64_20235 [Streptomyces albidoflavus]|nr:hypothetical protein C0Q64_20235 [Streptomyces albidoflavus]RZD99873.1 hypothetical protein C0Q65_20470 [Streptomyces albidoflavus]